MQNNKIWKLYDDKSNTFSIQSFETNKDLTSYWGYDFIYNEIYNWEFSQTGCIYEMFDCLIKPNDVVVDLGSNVGFFSVKSSEFASKVISIDGSPEAYSCLVENCKDLQNVLTLNANILTPESEQSWLWSVKGNPLRMTLDDVFDLYQLDRIDFLKCDIEGGEYDLFNSLSEETLSKIDRIAIETHDDKKNEHFSLPGKIKHSFYWTYNGGHQTMLYFTTPKNI
jgi:hypothetical protein